VAVKEAHAVAISVWLGDTLGLASRFQIRVGSAWRLRRPVSLPVAGVSHDVGSLGYMVVATACSVKIDVVKVGSG
jgi:uncharacterized membrane protein